MVRVITGSPDGLSSGLMTASIPSNQKTLEIHFDLIMLFILSRQEMRPSGAVLIPGCVVREVLDGETPGVKLRHCLQVSRPGLDSGASSIWLAAEAVAEFSEWKEMLTIAANKRRSRVSNI